MKKLNDLKEERTSLTLRYNEIMSLEMTDDLRSEASEIGVKIANVDTDVKLVERAEALAAREVVEVEAEVETEVRSAGDKFQDFLRSAMDGSGPLKYELRADPIVTTTDTDMINKTVAPGIDILTSPGEAFLRTLGVTFYPGLTGNYAVPSMAQDTATFPGEDTTAVTADMAPDSLVLASRRVTHFQSISKETLAQTNAGIYADIVQNLVNGIWNAVTNDVFDTLETDAATQGGTIAGSTLAYADIVNMEASIGGLNIGAGAYVTTPAVKGFLKQNVETTYGEAIWNDNEMNGYPAYGVPAANSQSLYFGDFSRMAVGQWGGIELIVDPYTEAKLGNIIVTAVALVDTGCTNKRALNFIADVSTS
jgi:HK97 family phage major capsid protein